MINNLTFLYPAFICLKIYAFENKPNDRLARRISLFGVHLTERRAREEWFLLREVKKIKGGPMREQIRSSEEKESQGCGTYRIQAVNAQCSTLFFQIAFLDYNLRICCSGTSLSNTTPFRIYLSLLQICNLYLKANSVQIVDPDQPVSKFCKWCLQVI